LCGPRVFRRGWLSTTMDDRGGSDGTGANCVRRLSRISRGDRRPLLCNVRVRVACGARRQVRVSLCARVGVCVCLCMRVCARAVRVRLCVCLCVCLRARVYVCECVYRPHESVVDRTTIAATAVPAVVPRRRRLR